MALKTNAETGDERIVLNRNVDQSPRHGDASVYRDYGPDTCFSVETDHPVQRHHIFAPQRRHRARSELLRLTSMAGPLFLQNIFSYSTSVIAVAFVGHLGDPVLLSSAVLASSLYNVTGYSLISGLSAGMETLCGQAYGAGSYKTLGLVLQRALLITWFTCLPIMLLWAHSEPLMLALGQQPAIAAGAARYLWNITPILFMGAIYECLKRYLLAQQVVLPGMVVTVITACLSPLYNWLLIFTCNLSLMGAAYAFILGQGTACILLLAYTAWRDITMRINRDDAATWTMPSIAAFQGWGKYLSYGVPAAVMICMEWWCYEVVIIMAGLLHNAEMAVGVMGIMYQINSLAYMSSMAYGSSANTRVSNELGAGNAAAAKLAVNTAVALTTVVQTCWAVMCLLADKHVMGLLSSNSEVVQESLAALPLLLPTFVSDAVNCLAQGVLRGAGRPGLGAILNIVGYWVFGIPMAWLFGLHMTMGVKGFWLALMLTSAGQCIVQMLVIARFDWAKEVDRAAILTAEHHEEFANKLAGDLDDAIGSKPHAGAQNGNHILVPNALQTQQIHQQDLVLNGLSNSVVATESEQLESVALLGQGNKSLTLWKGSSSSCQINWRMSGSSSREINLILNS